MTDLILPSKTKIQIDQARGKDKAVGISPWKTDDDNIIRKGGAWEQFYNMYYHHSIVRSAIDKIAKTATNVGYDFVPADSRARIRKNELMILKEFFGKQVDFIYELRRVYKDLLIYGDAFVYVVPNRARQPHMLKRLAPNTIAIRADTNGKVLGYVQFDPSDMTNSKYTTFEAHEILHFRIDDPDNDLYGLSPLASLEWAVAADIYAQKFNAAFFQNSGITGTIVSVKGVDPEEIARNRKFLMENYTGPAAAHKPIFLEGDSVTVNKSVVSHTDMGFLEGRKFIILEILAVLDVPPAKIGIMESANRSNSKEQDKTFRSESISPLQFIVESVINGQFVKPILGVYNTKFVHSEGDTRDAVELMNFYTRGIGWGIYNPNEVRQKMGMAPVEGGEINGMMTPTGFIPLDRMNLYFRQPKQNTDEVPPDPRDPAEGEPLPKDTTAGRVATGQSREIVKSHDPEKYEMLREGMMILLRYDEQEGLPAREVKKAYSYLHQGSGVDPAFDKIIKLVKIIKDEQDQDLQAGYFERIRDIFTEWLDRQEELYEES
jgi:HK97 family phage portal protein